MAWVLIVSVLALFQYQLFGIAVGRARARYGIHAPATAGHPVFERYFRVHMNTLEQLVMFLPSVWLFAQFIHPLWAAGLGGVYLLGRQLYFMSYVKEPKSRGLGFGLSSVPILAMLAGVLYAAIRMLLGYGG